MIYNFVFQFIVFFIISFVNLLLDLFIFFISCFSFLVLLLLLWYKIKIKKLQFNLQDFRTFQTSLDAFFHKRVKRRQRSDPVDSSLLCFHAVTTLGLINLQSAPPPRGRRRWTTTLSSPGAAGDSESFFFLIFTFTVAGSAGAPFWKAFARGCFPSHPS